METLNEVYNYLFPDEEDEIWFNSQIQEDHARFIWDSFEFEIEDIQ